MTARRPDERAMWQVLVDAAQWLHELWPRAPKLTEQELGVWHRELLDAGVRTAEVIPLCLRYRDEGRDLPPPSASSLLRHLDALRDSTRYQLLHQDRPALPEGPVGSAAIAAFREAHDGRSPSEEFRRRIGVPS